MERVEYQHEEYKYERNRLAFFWMWYESTLGWEWSRWPTNEFRYMWE